MNQLKTFFLMTFLIILFIIIGGLIGGKGGMIIAFFLAIFMNFISYWFSDKIVLSIYRAKEINREYAPEIFSILEELTQNANLPMPKVYIISSPSPNAFATGRNPKHSAVAVTTGILNLLSREELKGVLGHELTHIKNRDILIQTVAATIAGAISLILAIARFTFLFSSDDDNNGGILGLIGLIIFSIVISIVVMLIQMAISRSREYLADEGGAKISGNPLFLANALRKLETYSKKVPLKASPSTAHMFIVNPLKGKNFYLKLLSTHPPIEERIKRLERMARNYY